MFIVPVARDEEERLQVCQRLIRALPPLNYRVLEYLMNFVMKVRVKGYEEELLSCDAVLCEASLEFGN